MVLMEITVAMCNGSGTRCEPWWGVGLYLKVSVRYVTVNTDLDPLSYLLSSIGDIIRKDMKRRHIPKMIPQPIPTRLAA